MSPTSRPSPSSLSAQDRKLSHLSLAPPALETPSRFAALARANANASPRSRRARALRATPRAARAVLVLLALAAAAAPFLDWETLSTIAARAWRAF